MADARDTTQVLHRGGQAAASGIFLSPALHRDAQPVARGSVPRASKVLDRDAEAFA
jgi:hypothetical protein